MPGKPSLPHPHAQVMTTTRIRPDCPADLPLSSKLNVFGQLCNFIFEPRNLSLRLREMFLHLIHWFAHNFPQPCCCLGTSTMVLGSLAKTFLEWCGLVQLFGNTMTYFKSLIGDGI